MVHLTEILHINKCVNQAEAGAAKNWESFVTSLVYSVRKLAESHTMMQMNTGKQKDALKSVTITSFILLENIHITISEWNGTDELSLV